MMKKQCTQCKEEKDTGEYYLLAGRPRAECKACNIARTRRLQILRPELGEKWKRENKDKVLVSGRASYHKNKTPEKAEIARLRTKKWRVENREKHREYNRLYNKTNYDDVRARWDKWARLNPDKLRAVRMTRKALERGSVVEKINPNEVWKRSKGICGLCHEPMSGKVFEVDHIIPLSRGGIHSYGNVQATHPSCNRTKNSKMTAIGQLPLV